MQQSTSVIRFFERHRWMLRDPRFRKEAKVRLVAARHTFAVIRADAAKARAQRERSVRAAHQRTIARLRSSPVKAICHVFRNYCDEALRVARCESGYRTSAQNGQYLGMFQARAAYRYFVRTGRDWSPWSCKPWY